MATPAGANKERVEVGDSMARENPAGDLIAEVARDPLVKRYCDKKYKIDETI